MAVSE